MCEISDVTKVENEIILSCTPYSGFFMDSKTLKIHNDGNETFTTTDFLLDRTRPCFNNDPPAPWIMLKTEVPESFLQIGNRIELL